MNIPRLYEILNATTVQLRKGDVFEGSPQLVDQAKQIAAGTREGPLDGGGVLEVFAMPPASEAPSAMEQVDVHFMMIGVDKERAAQLRGDLIEILNAYPAPDRLASGPSYIEVGTEIGDQGAAFQLFALGKVLGLWDVITPARMGVEGEFARQMAGGGFIMITGYRPEGAGRTSGPDVADSDVKLDGDDRCPKCGGAHSGRYEGACDGPPLPKSRPPHGVFG